MTLEQHIKGAIESATAQLSGRLQERLQALAVEVSQAAAAEHERALEEAVSTARAQFASEHDAAMSALRAEAAGQRELAVSMARAEAAERLAAAAAERESTLAALRNELAAEHDAALAALRADLTAQHDAALALIRSESDAQHESALAAIRGELAAQHDAALEALQSDAAGQRESALTALRMEMTSYHDSALSEAIAAAVAATRAESSSAHEAALAAVQAEASARHDDALAALRAEVARERDGLAASIRSEQAAEHAAALAALRAEADERVARVRAESDDRLAHATAEADELLAHVRADAEQRLEAARKEAEELLARAQADADLRLVAARAEAERDLARSIDAAKADAAVESSRSIIDARVSERAGESAFGDRIVDATRRLDLARSLTEILDVLVEAASREVPRVAVFLLRGDTLKGWRAAGFGRDDDPRDVEVPLDRAGLLGKAVRSGRAVSSTDEPVSITGGAPFGALPAANAGLAIPLRVGGEPVAVLYADDVSAKEHQSPGVWPEAIEVLARHGARCLEVVTVSRVTQPVTVPARSTPNPAQRRYTPQGRGFQPDHDDDDDAARRYARLLVSEVKLYHEAAVTAGRRDRNLLERLRSEIERARRLYIERVPPAILARTDYFDQELVRTLANGDAALLGRA